MLIQQTGATIKDDRAVRDARFELAATVGETALQHAVTEPDQLLRGQDELADVATNGLPAARPEQGFCGGIEVTDLEIRRQHDDRRRQPL
jgi:hypothetical protein